MKFRKKPVEIEAIPAAHIIGEGAGNELPHWAAAAYRQGLLQPRDGGVMVVTLGGSMLAGRDWWINYGVKRELYPCRADVFTTSYARPDAMIERAAKALAGFPAGAAWPDHIGETYRARRREQAAAVIDALAETPA